VSPNCSKVPHARRRSALRRAIAGDPMGRGMLECARAAGGGAREAAWFQCCG
jgi:hypothetical protein